MFPEENNVDDTQDNELKIAILDVFKELKEHMNKCQNDDLENTSKELSKVIKIKQEMKIEWNKEIEN